MNTADPYSLSPGNGKVEKTFFQTLFPTQVRGADSGVVRDASRAKKTKEDVREKVLVAAALLSPSASDRIRAWELFPEKCVEHFSSGTESSGLDIHDNVTKSQDADVQQLPCESIGSSTVPFSVRVRETERRFREQMEVHRGLTAASRQIDGLQHSVEAFRVQRRTRALMQVLAERQAAIWARVWPDGCPQRIGAAAEAAHADTRALAPSQPVGTTGGSNTAVTASASGATSPPPPASPAGSLLQDILKTYSMPRDARNKSGVAAPAAPQAANAPKQVALTSTTETRRAATSVQILRPEAAPRPYAVMRYKLAISKHTLATPDAGDQRRSWMWASTGKPAAETVADIGVSRPRSEANHEEDEEEHYSHGFSSVVDEDNSGSVSTERSGSDAGDAVSTDDSDNVRTSSSTSSNATSVYDMMNKAKITKTNTSVPTEEATPRSVPYSASPEKLRGGAAARRPGCRYREGRRGSDSSSRVDDAQAKPLADILQVFFDACQGVSNASAQLLASSDFRDADDNADRKRQYTLQRTATRSSGRATPAAIDTVKAPELKKKRDTPGISADVADLPGASSTAWREALSRQLRNVRHLKRFRDHLFRNLERIDLQRQTHLQTTQLLQETQALAKVRRQLLSTPKSTGAASVGTLLRHFEKNFTGTRGGGCLRRGGGEKSGGRSRRRRPSPSGLGGKTMNFYDSVSEVPLTDMNSAMSRNISVDSDVIEELSYVGEGSDANISESIVQEEGNEWDQTSQYSEVASEGVIASDVFMSDGDAVDNSYSTDTFEEGSVRIAGRAARSARSGVAAGVGLDEIEEELVDRLAELSSNALSEGSPVPSEVEDLVNLLPSSLIPSEVDSDTASSRSDSTTTLASSVATSMNSSKAALQVQQRHMYVLARGTIARYAVAAAGAARGDGGELIDSKFYIRDSPGSSVYSVPEDADVDTSLPQSTDIPSENPPDSLWKGNEVEIKCKAATPLEVSGTGQTPGRSGKASSARRDESSSSSEDALTALELDMHLTKERRRTALRCAFDVPTFEQLYNPCVSPLWKGTASLTNTTSSSGSSRSATPDPHERGLAHDDTKGETGPTGPDSCEGNTDGVESRVTMRREASTQAEMGTPGRSPMTIPGASKMRVAYPIEDYVAQSAWKARQLHLLRQLKSSTVSGLESAVEDSADAALDAAEGAAREEWAQHWGVLESLLQTRFSTISRAHDHYPLTSSRHDEMILRRCLSSDSMPPSRDASLSSLTTASAPH